MTITSKRWKGQTMTDEERTAALAQEAIEPTMAVQLTDGTVCQQPVRRIAWGFAHPDDPVGANEVVYSTCGNASCVAPEHLAKMPR